MADYPELHIHDMSADDLDALLKQFPGLKDNITAEPSASPVMEDQETGLLQVIIIIAPPVLTFATALLNYLSTRKRK